MGISKIIKKESRFYSITVHNDACKWTYTSKSEVIWEYNINNTYSRRLYVIEHYFRLEKWWNLLEAWLMTWIQRLSTGLSYYSSIVCVDRASIPSSSNWSRNGWFDCFCRLKIGGSILLVGRGFDWSLGFLTTRSDWTGARVRGCWRRPLLTFVSWTGGFPAIGRLQIHARISVWILFWCSVRRQASTLRITDGTTKLWTLCSKKTFPHVCNFRRAPMVGLKS